MLRREARARVEHKTVGLFNRTAVIWVTLAVGRGVLETRLDDDGRQDRSPIPIWNRRGRDYWLFGGELYSTDVRLNADEVKALVIERELKEDARIARATAAVKRAALVKPSRRTPLPSDVRTEVWRRDGGRCVNCGSTSNLEFDHVIPRSMGGADTVRNIQLLCSTCNAAKGGELV